MLSQGVATKSTIKPSTVTILTGAGFTHNFGGYLARDMWNQIANQSEIADNPSLRPLMKKDLDYETIYDKVVHSNTLCAFDKEVFIKALLRAYALLEKIVCEEPRTEKFNVCAHFLQRFVTKEPRRRTFFFTVNHDLFIERFFYSQNSVIHIPGLQHSDWFTTHFNPDESYKIKLPDALKVEEEKQKFWTTKGVNLAYVKLHGSYRWYSNLPHDGMVIGHYKTETIRGQPLLTWYFEMFKEVLNDTRFLLVIGYGFGDEHINELIAHAADHCNLKVIVICPGPTASFRDELMKKPHGGRLWETVEHRNDPLHSFFYANHVAATPQCQNLLARVGLN